MNNDNVDGEVQQHTIDDLLLHAIDHQPKEFQAVFNDLLTQKILDRVEAAKQEVAQNYFNYEYESESEEQSDQSVDTETEQQPNEVEQNGQDAETV